MRFNAEQLEILSQFEDRFSTAVHLNYYRNTTSKSFDLINDIYAQAEGKKLANNWSCGHCSLTFLKTVGAKYFKDKEEFEKDAEKFVEVLEEVFDDAIDNVEVAKVQNESEPKPKKVSTTKKTNNKATKKK